MDRVASAVVGAHVGLRNAAAGGRLLGILGLRHRPLPQVVVMGRGRLLRLDEEVLGRLLASLVRRGLLRRQAGRKGRLPRHLALGQALISRQAVLAARRRELRAGDASGRSGLVHEQNDLCYSHTSIYTPDN